MEQATTIQATAAQPSLRKLLGLGAGQAASGDPFAMIFQQLMMGQGGNSEDLLFPLLSDSMSEDENLMGAQMAAEMLFTMPGISPQMILSQMQNSEMGLQNASNPGGSLNGLQANGLFAAMAAEEQNTPIENENQTAQDFYTVLSKAWKEPVLPTMGLHFQDGAVREAKQLLANQMKQPVEAIDLEGLQNEVDTKRFFPADMIMPSQEAMLPDPNELAAQLKDGILENVGQGKNEFVVRLKPEGIGEIVVKLSEDKSKIILSIFTASTQTAKLISNEVASLQNALRPLHAEVQQITVAPDGHAAEYAAQTAMDGQRQFSGQHSFGGHSQNPAGTHSGDDGEFGNTIQQTLEEEGLDTYI